MVQGEIHETFDNTTFKIIPYTFSVEQVGYSSKSLKIKVSVQDPDNIADFLQINFQSSQDEEIYGMGLQYTVWNFKGLNVPIISSEGGVGRGLEPLTEVLNLFRNNQGGNNMTTYAPAYSFLTNKNRGMIFNSSYIGQADFTQDNQTSFLFWKTKEVEGFLFVGDSPKSLVTELSYVSGRMRSLPQWIQNGVVLGLQGGQDKVMHNYQILKENGVPISAVWMQDWVGTKEFPEGVRLLWNWVLNQDFYPNWNSMINTWNNDGVKAMIYINPYFANLTDASIKRNLFLEGDSNGYFIKNTTGQTYLIKSVSIEFAIIDLTNPQARSWMKSIIKENMVRDASSFGWMHDFGEYTPFDIQLYNQMDPYEFHNQFPTEWAKINREAENEL